MEAASDEELMAATARGDRIAFQALVGRHLGRSLGLARRLTGNDADAEEVVQEALLRVWLHAPRWRPLAAFRTWFYRVVVNLCLNRRRRAPFAALEAAGDPPDPSPDALAMMQRDETVRAVAGAVAALPERQRAALVLTYYDGLGNAEAADVMGLSVAAVESLLVRAKRSLRTELAAIREEDRR